MFIKPFNISRIVSLGGILAAVAVIFQASPVILPVAGMILSPLSTLPVAISAIKLNYYGISTYLAAFFVLLPLSPQEAVIFLLTTGPYGLALGLSSGAGRLQTLLISGTALFAGIIALTYIAGIPAFGDFLDGLPLIAYFLVYLGFAAVYTAIWILLINKIKKAIG